jgi:ComF family protein
MVYTSLKTLVPQLLDRAQQWLLPSCCIACGGPGGMRLDGHHAPLDLCAACYRQLPFNLQACLHCGLPLYGTTGELICGHCLRKPPHYQRSYCAFEYRYPLAPLIRNFKYGAALAAARVLGELLTQHLRQTHQGPWPTCIIPMPLHASRYRSRGYNQVIELGRHLQRCLHLPLRLDLVTRARATAEQAGLSRRERRKNLRRAFNATTVSLPQHVAVLDDVITTGSTVNELAYTLGKAGVAYVEVWGLARAPNLKPGS